MESQRFKTGVVYDAAMKKHECEYFHPEQPNRISAIYEGFKSAKLLERCATIDPREATDEEITSAHTENHLHFINSIKDLSDLDRENLAEHLDSIFLNEYTPNAARLSAGCVVSAMEAVMSNKVQNAFAVVRPPGHHAEPDRARGFCLLNNVAIAARQAIEKFGVKKVLILDWDVHHGNGTQDIFYDDPNVLFMSIHRYDNGFFYPSSSTAGPQAIGEGQGKGFNVNVGWNTHEGSASDIEFMEAFYRVIMPIAYEFNPDLVFISAGFDAAIGDPLGDLEVSPNCYAHMTHLLSGLAGGKMVAALEGGYNLESITDCATSVLSVMLGNPLPSLYPTSVNRRIIKQNLLDIEETIKNHRPYWNSLVSINTQDNDDDDETPVSKLASDLDEISLQDQQPAKPSITSVIRSEIEAMDDTEEKRRTREIANKNAQEAGDTGGGVVPTRSCPHVDIPITHIDSVNSPCEQCESVGENWICLTCGVTSCGRYVQAHALDHANLAQHAIALSMTDLSVWCYQCDKYVESPVYSNIVEKAVALKFA